MKNQEIKVENFENLLLELCELCSQNKQSLLGKIGMKQAKLIEMFKECEGIIHNQSNNGWISVDDELPNENQLVLLSDNFDEQTMGKLIKKNNAHKAHDYTLRAIDDEFIFWLITTTDDYHYGTYHDIALISDFKYWQPMPQPPKE